MDALRANVICSLLHVLNYFKTSKRYDFPPSKRKIFLGLLPFSVEIEFFFSFSVRIEFFFHFLLKLRLRYLLMNKIGEFIDFKINGRFLCCNASQMVSLKMTGYHWAKWLTSRLIKDYSKITNRTRLFLFGLNWNWNQVHFWPLHNGTLVPISMRVIVMKHCFSPVSH